MKIYISTTSERNSRPAKKGGNEYLQSRIESNGIEKYIIIVTPDYIKVTDKNGVNELFKGKM